LIDRGGNSLLYFFGEKAWPYQEFISDIRGQTPIKNKNMGIVTVVGSTNVDLVARVQHLPRPGESVGNAVYKQVLGGKGSNQALAAARGGAVVNFVTCLGRDAFGQVSLKSLVDQELKHEYINFSDEPTGVALIMVDRDGENMISVAPGANHDLQPNDIDAAASALELSDLVLIQLEIKMETVMRTLDLCRQYGTKVMVNPAPVPAGGLPKGFLAKVDILVLNETETERILGYPVFGGMELPKIAKEFRAEGVGMVVITLGRKGCYVSSADFEGFTQSFPVKTVDSTGAGDVFCGYLAAGLADGRPLSEAVRFATAAGAIAVTRAGAQPSIPYLKEVIELIMQ